jgi:hypothetical protein
MSNGCSLPEDVLCGCCDGLTQETPQAITNRPALSAITYRIGTYSTFLGSMLAALSDPDLPALAALRTRDNSDFTIALLDAWAISLDILAFYQERFANEAFLRTAVDQRSVFELARLIGYVPSPGVAASTMLAFTLANAPGSPDNVTIPAGTRAQSVPGPGQTPQVFETSFDLTAVIAFNALPAQTHFPWLLSHDDTFTWITGSANNVNVGDALLFIATDSSGAPIAAGPADLRFVTRVHIDPASGNTKVWWNAGISSTTSTTTSNAAIYIFRKKAALFGANAINPFLLPQTTLSNIPGHPDLDSIGSKLGSLAKAKTTLANFSATDLLSATEVSATTDLVLAEALPARDWKFIYDGGGEISLDVAIPGLTASQPGQPQWLVLTIGGATALFSISDVTETNPNYYALTAKTSRLTLSFPAVLSGSLSSGRDAALTTFIDGTRGTTAYVNSDLLTPSTLPITKWTDATTFALAPGMIVPVQCGSIAVVGGQNIAAHQPIGISGKRVRLQVGTGSLAIFAPANASGVLPVSDSQVFLVNAFPPTTDSTGLLVWSVTTLSGVSGTLFLAAANLQLLPSDKADPLASEAALVDVVAVAGDITTLSLHTALSGIYDTPTVTVNANAVESTHGETVQELLGNGDGTSNALQFTLKQSPLTYVTAATGNGTQSTLQIWVNGLQWREVANLLSSSPADRVFTSRVSPALSRIVQFGDGINGSRTPTGQMNIRAVYRKGIGSAGMVNANQLSQALDRPQGLKSVTNPSAASGAAGPATAAEARQSAPLPTLTISRIVSLEDYQNFALNFAGIAKALATWTWFGARRGVFLTVAGANGAILKDDDPILLKLVAAIQAGGNPFIPLRVVSFVPMLFQIGASVKIDTYTYDSDQAMTQVWSNLQAAFAFTERRLAQNVVAGEIVEIIQNTPGVIATQLSSVTPSGEPPAGTVPAILCASGPLPPLGARMLLLDPASQGMIGAWS